MCCSGRSTPGAKPSEWASQVRLKDSQDQLIPNLIDAPNLPVRPQKRFQGPGTKHFANSCPDQGIRGIQWNVDNERPQPTKGKFVMIINSTIATTLAFGLPSGPEWIILLVIGLLIFGRRLPEVGRSLGKGIVEFKKGIKGIEHEIESETSKSSGKARLKDDSPDKARSAMYENAAEGSSKDA